MRWLVDGMNVIGSRPTGWWRDRTAAMARLVEDLRAFARETGEPVTVVFDGTAARAVESRAGGGRLRVREAATPPTTRSPGGWRPTSGPASCGS